MPTPPKMRDLAHRLLAYEADAIKTSKPMQSPTHPVYEKLGQSLVAFAGPTGFQLLAARALALARPEAPSLNTARASARRRKKAQKRVVGLESPQLLPCRRDFLQYLLLRSQVCFNVSVNGLGTLVFEPERIMPLPQPQQALQPRILLWSAFLLCTTIYSGLGTEKPG
jgi:hypothetical protein